jgi:hypothetical protein
MFYQKARRRAGIQPGCLNEGRQKMGRKVEVSTSGEGTNQAKKSEGCIIGGHGGGLSDV